MRCEHETNESLALMSTSKQWRARRRRRRRRASYRNQRTPYIDVDVKMVTSTTAPQATLSELSKPMRALHGCWFQNGDELDCAAGDVERVSETTESLTLMLILKLMKALHWWWFQSELSKPMKALHRCWCQNGDELDGAAGDVERVIETNVRLASMLTSKWWRALHWCWFWNGAVERVIETNESPTLMLISQRWQTRWPRRRRRVIYRNQWKPYFLLASCL